VVARAAVGRADALLKEHLTPEQRDDLERTRSFVVITPAGRRYRLHADRVNYQADLLAPEDEYVLAQYCVRPRDSGVPKSDSLLTQMLLLQADEALFLLTANESLLVHAPHRYLSGEITPKQPDAPANVANYQRGFGPEDAPTWVGVFDSPTVMVDANLHDPPVRRNPRQASQAEISLTYRCANCDSGVRSMTESPDGRGWRVRYDCDCPTQYVSYRAHLERERLRDEQVQTGYSIESSGSIAPAHLPARVLPQGRRDFFEALNRISRSHRCERERCNYHTTERMEQNDYRILFDCGAVIVASAAAFFE